jgi:hypothetical protein
VKTEDKWIKKLDERVCQSVCCENINEPVCSVKDKEFNE